MLDLEKLTSSIKAHEGTGPVKDGRFLPYVDTTNHMSIGWGRNISIKGVSQDEAELLLRNDIQSAIGEAEKEPWWPNVSDNDARSRALVECIFNLGLGGFRTFKNTITCLENSDFNGAAVHILASLWAKQTGRRSEVIAAMIVNGSD